MANMASAPRSLAAAVNRAAWRPDGAPVPTMRGTPEVSGSALRTAVTSSSRSSGSRAAASPVVPHTTTAWMPSSTSRVARSAVAIASSSPSSLNRVTRAAPTPLNTGSWLTAVTLRRTWAKSGYRSYPAHIRLISGSYPALPRGPQRNRRRPQLGPANTPSWTRARRASSLPRTRSAVSPTALAPSTLTLLSSRKTIRAAGMAKDSTT